MINGFPSVLLVSVFHGLHLVVNITVIVGSKNAMASQFLKIIHVVCMLKIGLF